MFLVFFFFFFFNRKALFHDIKKRKKRDFGKEGGKGTEKGISSRNEIKINPKLPSLAPSVVNKLKFPSVEIFIDNYGTKRKKREIEEKNYTGWKIAESFESKIPNKNR